jgi:ATP-dependent protease HslVU (ClpYQ) ATPase subunit
LEFDKLFISGNTNGELAHESTNGVQNEFLTVLEKGYASVFGEYGKYVNIPVGHLLFVFAGAFNNQIGVDHNWLREVGVKTEFLGRVPLIYNLPKIGLEDILALVDTYPLLLQYFELHDTSEFEQQRTIQLLKDKLTRDYEKNNLGIRYLGSLVHQIFINGAFADDEDPTAKKIVASAKFKRTTTPPPSENSNGSEANGKNTVGNKTAVRKRLSTKVSE